MQSVKGKDGTAQAKPAYPLPAGRQGGFRCSSVGWSAHSSPGACSTARALSSAGICLLRSKNCCLMRKTKRTKANDSHTPQAD